jgi:hypothetical protein
MMTGAPFVLSAIFTALLVQAQDQREYEDGARRFRFMYPSEFGVPSRGTNDGFGDRVAAIRFSVFSNGIGGEAALTRGFPVIDIQAAGGLYDAITLELFPEAMRRRIVQALTPLAVSNFCGIIAQEQHLDVQTAALGDLTAQQWAAIASTDRMRNVGPRVLQCVADGMTVTFDKEVAWQPDGPRQHVYGAVRFLQTPFSTFQIVRVGPAPDASILRQMTALVNSWTRF